MKRLLPIYVNKLSPCYSKDHHGNHGCYARNDIPRFLYLAKLGRFEEAFYVLKETNPFSSGCGRFCDHPCETACNRTKFGEAVDIKSLERFVSDWGYKNDCEPQILAPSNGKQVAVVGSGPSGLSAAYFLARTGYKVTVFEKNEKAGGLLTSGIPEYRYPREIFEKELSFIVKTGVEIKTGVNVNKNFFLNILQEYDAVIVATGAQKASELGIEGEYLNGVENGISFLSKINFGKLDELNIKKGEKIGVIGGGYTAMDVVRCSVRLGAEPTIVYRRTAEEMTAHRGEVEETTREGVQFQFLRSPMKIEKKEDKVVLKTQVMKLGPVDESGRSKPIPVIGGFEEYEFDRIILAIGDKPDLFFVGESFNVDYPRMICPDVPEDVRGKVFITGDASMGHNDSTGMVVRVVGLAQDTVKVVREHLGEKLESEPKRDTAFYKTLNTKYFEKEARLAEDTISFEEREGNFKEVVKGIDEDMAKLMAGRCFNCGICIQCDWCWHYSDGSIMKLNKEWTPEKDENFYEFLGENICEATYKSVEACPRSALSIIADGDSREELIDIQYVSVDEISEGGGHGH